MSELDFYSDNVANVSPEIMAAMERANVGTDASYGNDAISSLVNSRFSELFGKAVTVFPVSTGTAANAFSLAAAARPYGGIYCHSGAHILNSEGGAVGANSGGASLIALPGRADRLDAGELRQRLAASGRGNTQKPQPDAVSVTQATEAGTVYTLDELGSIGDIARENGLVFHMDGARFSNALVTLGCSAAAMTTGVGVDILSFGMTKNGGMNTEAIVVFEPRLIEPLSFILRRAGQTLSKMRFAAAQLLAFIEDQLYVRSAAAANSRAQQLANGLAAISGIELRWPVEANIVFPIIPARVIDSLIADGFLFSRRSPEHIRLVCRYNTTVQSVDNLVSAIRKQM